MPGEGGRISAHCVEQLFGVRVGRQYRVSAGNACADQVQAFAPDGLAVAPRNYEARVLEFEPPPGG